jgi:hypothetical protein
MLTQCWRIEPDNKHLIYFGPQIADHLIYAFFNDMNKPPPADSRTPNPMPPSLILMPSTTVDGDQNRVGRKL